MLWVSIDKNEAKSIIRQVYEQLSHKILRGELSAGEKLPSTRQLAEDLQVSRNVILEAYQLLLAEGFIVSIPNSGTFVAEGTFLAELTPPKPKSISDNSQEFLLSNDVIDFRSGVPALDFLPRKKWNQLARDIILDTQDYLFGYDFAPGRMELREAICRYLQRTRGVICHPDQIIITTGSIQSFSIIAKALLKDQAQYVIEEPLHVKIRDIFASVSSNFYPVPVDESGIQTHLLPQNISPRFIFVTPSHQYPLGGNLPVQRRIDLVNYARANQCYLVEDDYDSEFRYEGLPVSSLQGLAPEAVIYLGSFSKILFPALRLGYMILPWELVTEFRRLKEMSDHHSNTIEQLILARFIEERHLERHIAKMKKVYHQRRDCLINELKRFFSGEVKIEGESTGLHLIAEFDKILFTEEVVDHLRRAGVLVYPAKIHYVDPTLAGNKLIMGYSHLTPEQIKTGIEQLYHFTNS